MFDFEQLENKILEQGLLYQVINGDKVVKQVNNSLKEYLTSLFSESNICSIEKENIDTNFYNSYARRSLTDLYRICKSYFPDLRLIELQKELLLLKKEGVCTYFFCKGTGLRVWCKTKYLYPYYYDISNGESIHMDELGVDEAALQQALES